MPVLSLRPQLGAAPAVEQALPFVFVELDLGNLVSGAILDDPLTAQLDAGPAAPWAPTDITGLEAWYDFSNVSTLWKDSARTTAVTADGDTILGVTDLSGNAQHLSGTVGPLYKTGIQAGLSASLFAAASSQRLSGGLTASSETLTWFVVAKLPTTVATHSLVGPSAGAAFQLRVDTTNTISILSASAANIATSSVTYTDNISSIIGASYTAAGVYRLFIAGGTTNTGTNDLAFTAGRTLEIGRSVTGEYLSGYILECFRYDSALSLANINLVGAYLATKWAVTWTTAT